VLQAVGVLSVTAIGGTPAGLHIGGVPLLGADAAKKGRRVKGSGAHFHVQRLLHDTAALGPELLQRQNQALEGCYIGFCQLSHGVHLVRLQDNPIGSSA